MSTFSRDMFSLTFHPSALSYIAVNWKHPPSQFLLETSNFFTLKLHGNYCLYLGLHLYMFSILNLWSDAKLLLYCCNSMGTASWIMVKCRPQYPWTTMYNCNLMISHFALLQYNCCNLMVSYSVLLQFNSIAFCVAAM